jgi:hypothetical protein
MARRDRSTTIDAYEDSIVSGISLPKARPHAIRRQRPADRFRRSVGTHHDRVSRWEKRGIEQYVGFYDPANPTAAVLRLNAAESPNGPFVSPADMVTVPIHDGTLLYVSDVDANRIVVFTIGQTAVDEFMLY